MSNTPLSYRVLDSSSGALLASRLRPAHTHWSRLRGLLGTRALAPGDGLWLKPCRQVHMFGMRYPIDVVFLDDELRVVKTVAALQPGKMSPHVGEARSVLELPAGTLAALGVADGARLVMEDADAPPVGQSASTEARADAAAGSATQGPRRGVRFLTAIVAFVVLTALLVPLARATITWSQPSPGFICYWSAAKLLASGRSPYDLEGLKAIQTELGWDKVAEGLGFFDYLPNYYPPSLLSAVTVLLVPLGFTTARITWLVASAELLFVVGCMLRSLLPSMAGKVPMLLIPVFCLSIVSVLVGQVTALMLFAIVAVWKLLDERWDRTAGWLLAWAVIKPSLMAVLVFAILLWSGRRGRWRVVQGFVGGVVALFTVSTWLVPGWPLQLLTAMSTTSFVTATFPSIGTTWLLVLSTLGLEGWTLWSLYALLALPFLVAVARLALDVDRSLNDVIALSLLAAFLVSPPARPYDQPLLLLTLLVLVAQRPSYLHAGPHPSVSNRAR